MSTFLGFGNGHDATTSISGDPNTRTSCSGTSGANTLAVTSESGFVIGDMVLIHQSRGAGVGAWEVNFVSNVASGVLTLVHKLSNTYTDSGASQAQCILVPQYSGLTITGGGPSSWNGNVGGIYVVSCSGKITVSGTLASNGSTGTTGTCVISATSGGGYYGGGCHQNHGAGTACHGGAEHLTQDGGSGEGTVGASAEQNEARGNGGGGGDHDNWGSGAGGGNGTAGSNGNKVTVIGGAVAGSADLSTIVFGGGGGSAQNIYANAIGMGGSGAGIIILLGQEIVITGAIQTIGGTGANGDGTGDGGSGAGGSVLIIGATVNIGTDKIDTRGGVAVGSGGAGGKGRVRVDACTLTGSLASTYYGSLDENEGGHDFCGAVAQILGG